MQLYLLLVAVVVGNEVAVVVVAAGIVDVVVLWRQPFVDVLLLVCVVTMQKTMQARLLTDLLEDRQHICLQFQRRAGLLAHEHNYLCCPTATIKEKTTIKTGNKNMGYLLT